MHAHVQIHSIILKSVYVFEKYSAKYCSIFSITNKKSELHCRTQFTNYISQRHIKQIALNAIINIVTLKAFQQKKKTLIITQTFPMKCVVNNL